MEGGEEGGRGRGERRERKRVGGRGWVEGEKGWEGEDGGRERVEGGKAREG